MDRKTRMTWAATLGALLGMIAGTVWVHGTALPVLLFGIGGGLIGFAIGALAARS